MNYQQTLNSNPTTLKLRRNTGSRTPTDIKVTKNDTINDTATSVQIMDNSTVKINDFSSNGDVHSISEQEMYSLSKNENSSLNQTGNQTSIQLILSRD